MSDKSPNVTQQGSQDLGHKLIVEKDVWIPLRDGGRLCADIFRPDTKTKVPVIANITVYQKDKLWIPPADLDEKANPHMNWETANPQWWCPREGARLGATARLP